MADSDLPRILSPAPHGSKRGWQPVTADLPPETVDRLDELASRRPSSRSQLIYEAVEQYLERQAA